MVERRLGKAKVSGSIPDVGSTYAVISYWLFEKRWSWRKNRPETLNRK